MEQKNKQPEHLKMKDFKFRAVINKKLEQPVISAQNEKQARKKLKKQFPAVNIISCMKLILV